METQMYYLLILHYYCFQIFARLNVQKCAHFLALQTPISTNTCMNTGRGCVGKGLNTHFCKN